MSWTDAAGLAGVLMILVAYAGAALGRLDPKGAWSLLANLVGAAAGAGAAGAGWAAGVWAWTAVAQGATAAAVRIRLARAVRIETSPDFSAGHKTRA